VPKCSGVRLLVSRAHSPSVPVFLVNLLPDCTQSFSFPYTSIQQHSEHGSPFTATPPPRVQVLQSTWHKSTSETPLHRILNRIKVTSRDFRSYKTLRHWLLVKIDKLAVSSCQFFFLNFGCYLPHNFLAHLDKFRPITHKLIIHLVTYLLQVVHHITRLALNIPQSWTMRPWYIGTEVDPKQVSEREMKLQSEWRN